MNTPKERQTKMNWLWDTEARCRSLWQLFSRDAEASCWPTEADWFITELIQQAEVSMCWSTLWATCPNRAATGASTGTQSDSYKQTSSQAGSLCVFVYRKEKRKSWSIPRIPRESSLSSLSSVRKWTGSGRSLVLRPLDALQVDAVLNHLPQRTGRQTDRERDRLLVVAHFLITIQNT